MQLDSLSLCNFPLRMYNIKQQVLLMNATQTMRGAVLSLSVKMTFSSVYPTRENDVILFF